MTRFYFTLVDNQGKTKNGQIEADSRSEAADQIKSKGWFISYLKEKKEASPVLSFSRKEGKEKISPYERILFTDHLAAMFKSATPLFDALETYLDEENKNSESIIEGLIKHIQRGKKLSEAMAYYPQVFSNFYLSLIQAGELTGRLDETLEYLAKELRREYEFNEKIKSALLYPALVLTTAVVVILLLVFLVIPRITQLTKSFGGNLPFITRMVASLAETITVLGPFIVPMVIISGIALVAFLKNPETKEKIDPLLLRLSLVGPLLKKYILTRFLRVIGSCLKYGVSLASSLTIVQKLAGNILYAKALERIKLKIIKGTSLSEAISQESAKLFPKTLIKTIKGAEKTGYVDEAMIRLSKFYEDDIDRELKRVTDLIEPILVIFLGIIVAAIAIAVVAPIYQMTSVIK